MSAAEPSEVRAALLDDFYAESDEHLATLRRELLVLEQHAGATPATAAAYDQCFRNLHSLKGNAAIVGLHAAELLAHGAEDLLRAGVRGEAAPDRARVQLLGRIIQRLEAIVAAHRRQEPLPDAADLLAEIASGPGHDGGAVPAAPPPGTSREGRWQCIFSPAQELDRRGININTVRARLSALGEIISAAPTIRPNGSMQFEFIVAISEPPSNLPAWAADGMSFHPAPMADAPTETVAAEPAPAASPTLFIAPSHAVRVDLARLDDLMRIAGEMVIHRSRLEERIVRGADRATLQEVNLALGRSLRELRDAITRARMVPVVEVFGRMPFVVRDLARDSGKKVRLAVEGEHTEIDKYVVERLKEPLLHLVRNAISHGVEPPEARVRAGKAPEAELRLRAAATGNSVLIHVGDDGAGIDRAALSARATRAGLALPAEASDDEILDLLCHPGFSTRDEADRAAGRGVGMTVVRSTVRELGGDLTFTSAPGRGTQFSLRLPLTLSIAETFLVNVGEHTCALPQEFVREVVPLADGELCRIQHAEVIRYRAEILPVLRLRTLFGLAADADATSTALVLHTERGKVALIVDRVRGRREVVVRAMRDPLVQVPGVSGATELGDGRPVLILDAAALVSRAAARPRAAALPRALEPVSA